LIISDEVSRLKSKLIEDKAFFNSHPELGFNEHITADYISSTLISLGFSVKKNVAGTGVVGLLGQDQDKNKQCILFRADMDAVLMNPEDPSSVKHTCGHDAHMAILLGLARILSKNISDLKGMVKLVFQPGEEGLGGAELMIKQGVLDYPHVDKVFALHVWSELLEGEIGIQDGAIMASGDEFTIEVIGKSGHAALPEKCVDAIAIASQIITALQFIVSRNINPLETVVISIGTIFGGCNYNTICEKVTIKGTCRTYNNQIRQYISERIKNTSISIARCYGGDAIIDYRHKHPAVVNSNEEALMVSQLSETIVGSRNVIKNYKTMCTEDFSHYLQYSQGALVFIGCQGERYFPQHNPNYYVDESALLIGLELFYQITKKYLY